MSNPIEINTIVNLKIGDNTITITLEEAKLLKEELDKLFRTNGLQFPPGVRSLNIYQPLPNPIQPHHSPDKIPWAAPQIWCKNEPLNK